MRRALRENAPCALAALAGSALLAWLGLKSFLWSDYELELLPSVQALTHGDLHRFLALAPVYGGSLIERSPAILLPGLWGGGQPAVYRALAAPGLLACALLAVLLVAGMRRAGASRLAKGTVVALCVCNPVSLIALEYGHSEELLGGALCIFAVLLAARPGLRRRGALLAGLALGLAIADKQWAIVAAPAVLLALPAGLRRWCLLAAALSAGCVLAPLLLAGSGGFTTATVNVAGGAATTLFEPWQVWWFLGHHGLVPNPAGALRVGYRIGPAWVERYSRDLVVAGAGAIGAAAWAGLSRGRAARSSGRLDAQGALCALCLLLLARCLLDTWDALYYPLPFLLALTAWESTRQPLRPPLLALIAGALVWLFVEVLHSRLSGDAQSALFLAWSVPLAVWLAWRLGAYVRAAATAQSPQATTVSSLGRPVRTSRPSGRTTTRSSMRTPSVSGR
jgi:hypothetical protein